MDSKMLDPQRVLEAKVDATMDELEADIQRRLNLIKQSLAKLDAPLDDKTTKSGIQITTYWRATKSNVTTFDSYFAIDSYLDSLFFNMRLKLPIIIHPVLQNGQENLKHQKPRFNNLISILKIQI